MLRFEGGHEGSRGVAYSAAMTTIFHDQDADLAALAGAQVAVVGYGNQGRSWALNLRDSGFPVQVCVRADASREQAVADGFEPGDLADAATADVVCVLIPDDAIPSLGLERPAGGLTIVASGYTLAFDRFAPAGDVGMVAPRMLGPEVRKCFEEGIGFITAVGVHQDATGRAQERVLALAKAIGGLKQGAIEMSAMQEAVLDLAVEQALSPALTMVNGMFTKVMLEHGIPLALHPARDLPASVAAGVGGQEQRDRRPHGPRHEGDRHVTQPVHSDLLSRAKLI